jgi:RNA polymerase sigma-70 factor (ECF subfamily)
MSFGKPTCDHSSLANLITAVQNGDLGCFGEIYDQFVEQIFRFVYFKTGERAAAQDLTQNVFLKAMEKIDQLKGNGSFASWLYAIARNVIADYYRGRNKTVSLRLVGEIADSGNGHSFESKETLEETLKALGTLNEDEQEVILLHCVEEYSFEEIAKITKKSPGALRILKHRALGKLKTAVDYGK